MRKKLYIVALMAFALLMAACESTDNDISPIGDQDYGSYTTTDEDPAFGDSELLTLFQEDPQYQDPLANDTAIRNAERNRYAKHYLVRILWGNLDTLTAASDPTGDCPITDWSGSIMVNGGVISILRLVRFETDDGAVPSRSAREFSWISHTSNDVDGILFKVIDTPNPATETLDILQFKTKQYEIRIPFSALVDYSNFVFIDECNKISIVATQIYPSRCPGGFLEGLWISETNSSGYFKGVWFGYDGSISGYVRGEYNTIDGNRVLFGKWIDSSGGFGGLLKGTWSPLPKVRRGPDGSFEGFWVDDDSTRAGWFKGHYCFRRESDQGWFHGKWRLDCR
ncbi:MAG: hypothetical protein ACUVUU_04610 [bacterium]